VLASGQEGSCFPSGPASRVLVNEGGSLLPVAGHGHPQAATVCAILSNLGVRPTTVDTLQNDECFVLVVLGEIPDDLNLEGLRHNLVARGKEAGLSLRVQREDVFRAMHRI
jgi:predicted amino acid-binding ACT domain protein